MPANRGGRGGGLFYKGAPQQRQFDDRGRGGGRGRFDAGGVIGPHGMRPAHVPPPMPPPGNPAMGMGGVGGMGAMPPMLPPTFGMGMGPGMGGNMPGGPNMRAMGMGNMPAGGMGGNMAGGNMMGPAGMGYNSMGPPNDAEGNGWMEPDYKRARHSEY